MNIFEVLSSGKGKLHEPSMSAMLGYLLDSGKDHGLGDSVVKGFLNTINEDERFSDILNIPFIKTEVDLEEPYSYEGTTSLMDIQLVLLFEKNNKWQECHRIIIENKIKEGAAQQEQLQEYYSAVTNNEPEMDALTFVFLTPNNDSNALAKEYEYLMMKENTNHKKFRVYWGSGERCISTILKDILIKEAQVDINPINEYMRHTIKSFVRHSLSIEQKQARGMRRNGQDLGEIIHEVDIKIKNVHYTILKRDTGQIQVLNSEGNKVPARPLLLSFVNDNNIVLTGALSQRCHNTRSIGTKCIRWLEAQS